jgi:hypothetical protein
MKDGAKRLFARRVHLTLGWAVLIGMCASLNLIGNNVAEREKIIEQAAVIQTAPPERKTAVAPPEVPLSRLSGRQRTVAWFTRYDNIRREAQMTPAEKALVLKLWATSYVASDRDTRDARSILTSMVNRYDHAYKKLSALPEIPETRNLHRGYLSYFKKAHSDFSRYLDSLESDSIQAAVAQMQAGRQELAAIDVQNKSLDRKLRERFHIKDFEG